MNPALMARLWLLLALSFLMSATPSRAQSEDGQETTDWPSVISRLRQDMYQRPGQASIRQQLAIAYNNYGVQLGTDGQWSSAIQQLQEALRLDGESEQFRRNLSNIYFNQAHQAFERHATQEAAEALNKAISLTPDFAQAYVLLGQLEYDRQKLKEAKAAWQRAVALDPSQTELAQRLDRLNQELPVESKFERLSQAYFDLRYEEQLAAPVGFDVREALMNARRDVGSDFAYWPKYKIVVLIYSAESFRALRQEMPEWVAGQFDGKIRIPLPNGRLGPEAVEQILFHEYTHALVHDLTGGKCPIWLNEGLAEYEGRKAGPSPLAQLVTAQRAGRLVPWAALSQQFSAAMPVEDVALGYQQSYSIVQYLVKRYGFWRMRRVLEAVGKGTSWEQVLADEFRMKLTRLEAIWREWLPELLGGTS